MRIGVFDSGVGGLSVLRAMLAQLPEAEFVYLADSAYAPYGDKSEQYIVDRAQALARHLVLQEKVQMIVVACNTATAAAVKVLREVYPQTPIVGIEPAIKPAVRQTRSHRIGVMATTGTVNSTSFQKLRKNLEENHPEAEFQILPCEGLAKAIEEGFRTGDTEPAAKLAAQFASRFQRIDTLVLGCTHYPFVQNQLEKSLGQEVRIIEPSEAVAQQAKRLCNKLGFFTAQDKTNPLGSNTSAKTPSKLRLLSSGDTGLLQAACRSWLHRDEPCAALA